MTDTTAPEEWFRVPRVDRAHLDPDDVPLHELLAGLGETPDEVAEKLREERCFGPRYNDCFCPIAHYIAKYTGKAASATALVCAIGEFTWTEGRVIDTFIPESAARTPEAVGQLITAYDRGDYGFLAG